MTWVHQGDQQVNICKVFHGKFAKARATSSDVMGLRRGFTGITINPLIGSRSATTARFAVLRRFKVGRVSFLSFVTVLIFNEGGFIFKIGKNGDLNARS